MICCEPGSTSLAILENGAPGICLSVISQMTRTMPGVIPFAVWIPPLSTARTRNIGTVLKWIVTKSSFFKIFPKQSIGTVGLVTRLPHFRFRVSQDLESRALRYIQDI